MDIKKWAIKKAMGRCDKQEVARLLRGCSNGISFTSEECKALADFIEKETPKPVGRPKEKRTALRDPIWLMSIYGLFYLSEIKTIFKNREEAQQAFCEEQLQIGGFHNGTFIKLYRKYGYIARSFLPSKKK